MITPKTCHHQSLQNIRTIPPYSTNLISPKAYERITPRLSCRIR